MTWVANIHLDYRAGGLVLLNVFSWWWQRITNTKITSEKRRFQSSLILGRCSMFIWWWICDNLRKRVASKWPISFLILGGRVLAAFNRQRWLTVQVKEEPPVFSFQARKLLFIDGKGAKIHWNIMLWLSPPYIFRSEIPEVWNEWNEQLESLMKQPSLSFFSFLCKRLPFRNQPDSFRL